MFERARVNTAASISIITVMLLDRQPLNFSDFSDYDAGTLLLGAAYVLVIYSVIWGFKGEE